MNEERNIRLKEVVPGVWAKLHIEEFNDVYSSPNIINMTTL
jgi:hypothetical protein